MIQRSTSAVGKYWLLLPVFFTAIAIASATLWQLTVQGGFGMQEMVDVFIPEIIFWNMWGLVAPLIFRISRRFSYPVEPLSWKWIIHLPLALLIILCTYTLYIVLFSLHFEVSVLLGFPLSTTLNEGVRARVYSLLGFGLPMGCIVYSLLVALSQVQDYFGRLGVEEQRSGRLQTQLAEAKLQALKMQLHPHFLFNALNTISATLQTDKEAADRMISQLGDFLRITLEQADRAIVSLKEELDFNQQYLEIEKLRFEERLTVHVNVSAEAEHAAVPYLILQPLVENAIQHGIGQSIENGIVSIDAFRENGSLVLDVQNTAPGERLDVDQFQYGIGLSNTESRLFQHYGEAGQLKLRNKDEGGIQVRVRIPFKLFKVDKNIAGDG